MRHAFKVKVQQGPKYKFGVMVPQNPWQAVKLDRVSGNNLWKESTDKELKQINDHETFREPGPDDNMGDYKIIPYHMVYDVKFDGRRKARLVAGGNWTDPPREDIYSGVIGMDTVRLGFALAAMHNLKVCAADIGNAFLYGKTREKVAIKAGPEFGVDCGKTLIIIQGPIRVAFKCGSVP